MGGEGAKPDISGRFGWGVQNLAVDYQQLTPKRFVRPSGFGDADLGRIQKAGGRA